MDAYKPPTQVPPFLLPCSLPEGHPFFFKNLCLGSERVKFKWSQGKLYNWDSHNAIFIALKQQS